MTETRRTQRDGGTQGLVDERLHSWTVPGDKGVGWWAETRQRSSQEGHNESGACQNENLLLRRGSERLLCEASAQRVRRTSWSDTTGASVSGDSAAEGTDYAGSCNPRLRMESLVFLGCKKKKFFCKCKILCQGKSTRSHRRKAPVQKQRRRCRAPSWKQSPEEEERSSLNEKQDAGERVGVERRPCRAWEEHNTETPPCSGWWNDFMQVKGEAGLPERSFRLLITVGLRFLLPKQQIHVEIYISLKKTFADTDANICLLLCTRSWFSQSC